MACTPMATATFAGESVRFAPTHREFNDTPVAMNVEVSLPLSLEDITAALWLVIDGGMTFADAFESPQRTHALVLETMFGNGGCDVASALVDIAEVRPGSFEHGVVSELRQRVHALYGTERADLGTPSEARQLAGVS